MKRVINLTGEDLLVGRTLLKSEGFLALDYITPMGPIHHMGTAAIWSRPVATSLIDDSPAYALYRTARAQQCGVIVDREVAHWLARQEDDPLAPVFVESLLHPTCLDAFFFPSYALKYE